MKLIIFNCLFILGCASVQAANPASQPTGEEVFNALLAQSNMSLSAEPLCKEDRELYKIMSSALSLSYDKNNITNIKSYCTSSKFEISSGNAVDVWDCSVEIVENNAKGEYIASAIFEFNLGLNDKQFIKGSLRCR